ncbi:MAG TPA: TetR/AcrR family transcriptional regulator [Acidimicrobiales bacterium]|nr:TetR/AcrR family transcriptional regulator [Acidimicrobiales bacterium]
MTGFAPGAGHAAEVAGGAPAPDTTPRGRLLAAARRVLTRDGLEGLTLRAIAREAGVSHGAPLRHFPSLAALLAAVAAEGFTWLADSIDTDLAAAEAGAVAAGSVSTPRQRLAVAGRAYLRFALDDPGLFSVTFRPERIDVSDVEYLTQGFRAFSQLRDLVEAAQADGWLPDLPATDLAGVLWAHVHGIATLAIHGGLVGVIEGDDAVDRLMGLSISITVGPEGDTR